MHARRFSQTFARARAALGAAWLLGCSTAPPVPAADGGMVERVTTRGMAVSQAGAPAAIGGEDPDQPLIALETADAPALQALADWSALPVLGTGLYRQTSSHDRGDDDLADNPLFGLFQDGNRDLNNFVCKSADARVGTPIMPYHYDLSSCPESYVRGVELARYAGSGKLVRFWFTAASLAGLHGLADEILRVYVDDQLLLQLPLAQVLDGSAGEIFAPPFGAGSRAFIAWYYPVVFNHKLVVALDRLSGEYYFQTDVVLDARTTQHVVPRERSAERERAAAQLTAASPVPADASTVLHESLALAPGEARALSVSGPRTLRELRLRVPKGALANLSGVRISVSWDAAARAAIDLPLLELFAAARAPVERTSLALAASDEGADVLLALRLPMPFRTRADIRLSHEGSVRAEFQLDASAEDRLPRGDFGYLHVQRSEAPRPATALERSVAEANGGAGRYVGLCADLEGHPESSLNLGAAPLNLLEGDVRASSDGARALDGTGTEDYPDNAFYFLDSPKATAFAQNWAKVDDSTKDPSGQISFCRWQVLGNEVDFSMEFAASMEISRHDTSIVDLHRSVAYLYLR